MIARVFALFLLSTGALACRRDSPTSLAPPEITSAEEGEVVARVGGLPISSRSVQTIARAQKISPRAALEQAARDALFARAALDRRLDLPASRDLRGALAKSLIATFRDEAIAEGPITDAELESFSASHYFDVARPEAWLVEHALVPCAADADDATVKKALALAQALRSAVLPGVERTRTETPTQGHDALAATFLGAANAFDAGGVKVVAEALPPVAADGKTVEPNQRAAFDPAFVKAAVELERRGDVSQPARSSFGFHVILLLSRIPARLLSPEERRDLFGEFVLDRRAQAYAGKLLAELRAAGHVDITPNADALLNLVRIGDDTFAPGDREPAAGAPP